MLWAGTYGFSSLPEKTRKSNHLQMSLQRQHFLLSYLKTLGVGPASVWTRNLPLGRPAFSRLSEPGGGCFVCASFPRSPSKLIFGRPDGFAGNIWHVVEQRFLQFLCLQQNSLYRAARCASFEGLFGFSVRPGSDAVLFMCRTQLIKFDFGATLERQLIQTAHSVSSLS